MQCKVMNVTNFNVVQKFLEIKPKSWISDSIFTRVSTLTDKKMFENVLKESSFYRKRTDLKFVFLQLWPSVLPWRWPIAYWEKLQPFGYRTTLCQNHGPISFLYSGKNAITFCAIWVIFGRKQGEVTSKRVGIKVWHILFYLHDFWSTSCKNIFVGALFAARGHKGHFRKTKFNPNFQVWLLFLMPCLHFWKK